MTRHKAYLITWFIVVLFLGMTVFFHSGQYNIYNTHVQTFVQENQPHRLLPTTYLLWIQDCMLQEEDDSNLIKCTIILWLFYKLYKLLLLFIYFYLRQQLCLQNNAYDIRMYLKQFLISYFNGSRHKSNNPLPTI